MLLPGRPIRPECWMIGLPETGCAGAMTRPARPVARMPDKGRPGIGIYRPPDSVVVHGLRIPLELASAQLILLLQLLPRQAFTRQLLALRLEAPYLVEN